ncbi:MAG: hypothetical protein FJZ60_04345 [Chlamydiae bacterium]|nr:hypothetical protein [Chlamydiota bacterium]
MHLIHKLLEKIEYTITLGEPFISSFEKGQKKLFLPQHVLEKTSLFLPLLSFPILFFDRAVFSILYLFFILMLCPKKSTVVSLIEPAIFLSIGSLYPELAPFAFLWIISSWILTHHSPAFFFAHPIHRFLWIATVLLYLPLVKVLAPLLLFMSTVLAIHSQFFVWKKS